MKNLFASCFVLFFWASSSYAQTFDHSHQRFDDLLKTVVSLQGHQSRVDYVKLLGDSSQLEGYLSNLSSITKREFEGFSRDQQLAFLINAYNGFQLKQVIDNYPIDSIKEVGSFFSSPWSKKFFKLLGEEASLDIVEHELIRPVFKEPRIHFAVNCASISCPPLMPEAYQAEKLDTQLENATFNFLQDRNANYRKGKTLYLSKIFDWYEEDFGENVSDFVAPYMGYPPGDLKIQYTDYDWNLNLVNPGVGA